MIHGETGGMPPEADLERARALHEFVARSSRAHEVNGIHDVSDGGLAVALSEMAFAGEVGFRVDLATDGCTWRKRVSRSRRRASWRRSPLPTLPTFSLGQERRAFPRRRSAPQGAITSSPPTRSTSRQSAHRAWRDALPRLMTGA